MTELKGHTQAINQIVYNPANEKRMASVSSDGTLRLWDLSSNTCTNTVSQLGTVLTVDWNATGTMIALSDATDHVHMYDVKMEKIVYKFKSAGQVHDLRWSEKNPNVLIKTNDNKIAFHEYVK